MVRQERAFWSVIVGLTVNLLIMGKLGWLVGTVV